jgi:trimethylamine---corrinoid protein Co-methyltransferase
MKKAAGQREGVLVEPVERLESARVEAIHETSLKILEQIGVHCFNRDAAKLFEGAGCRVSETDEYSLVKFPPGVVIEAVGKAPSRVVLGARDPENRLILDAGEPRVRFGSGSEANVFLEAEPVTFTADGRSTEVPVFHRLKGNAELLCTAARLCQQLDNLDFFIRTVNLQDGDISESDKDVNKFFASLANIDKHVMAGLTDAESLDKVIRMGEIITGGAEELRDNPVLSFITCITKSPLQLVRDTTEKMMRIVRSGMPVVISSSPQGGTTAPIQEAGMVTQINAEILAGIALSQLVKPGAPVLYGSVPVRARMDDLHDLYGAPEFCSYNADCIQMARFYELPSYSTAGVGDACVPGVQATVEKAFSHLFIPMAGAQYVHYAFGLLEKTNVFSPDQAVLDDAQIGTVKRILSSPRVGDEELDGAFEQILKVMGTSNKLYARYARKGIRDGSISPPYFFDTTEPEDRAVIEAHRRRRELLQRPAHLPEQRIVERIFDEIPGIVERINPYT